MKNNTTFIVSDTGTPSETRDALGYCGNTAVDLQGR